MNNTSKTFIDPMQLMRLQKYPIKLNGNDNLLVFDDLESGTLRIYESEGPVCIQQLFTRYMTITNAVLIAEIVINENWKGEEDVFIHKINCESGYEELVSFLVERVMNFGYFYNQFESVGISELQYEKWLPYAKDILKDFQKINRVYECYLDGHKEE